MFDDMTDAYADDQNSEPEWGRVCGLCRYGPIEGGRQRGARRLVGDARPALGNADRWRLPRLSRGRAQHGCGTGTAGRHAP